MQTSLVEATHAHLDQASGPVDTLESLQQRKQQLTLQAECLALESHIRQADLTGRYVDGGRPVNLLEAWGDLVDRREFLYDTPGWGYDRMLPRISAANDREHGRNAPHFLTEQDLATMRGIGRWLCGTDETAIGIMENFKSYTVGTGFAYRIAEKTKGSAAQTLIDDLQAFVDELLDANQWRRKEREWIERTRRDGDLAAYIYRNRHGIQVRFIEPDEITEPMDPNAVSDYAGFPALDWAFGVGTAIGNTEDVYGYHYCPDGDTRNWEFLDAEQVEFCKINVDAKVKRGMSDFYAASADVERASKLSRNTAEGAAIQASIAYIKEAAGATSRDDITSANSGRTAWAQNYPTQYGQKTANYERFFPGRVITTAGMKYHSGPLGSSNAPTFIEVVQMVLRRVGQRWCFPEYLISGDASNANYASTLVSESPFVKAMQGWQVFYAESFMCLLWKAIAYAQRLGMLSVPDVRELKRRVKIDIECPQIASRDTLKETQRREIMFRNKIMSVETWQVQEELDPATEDERIEQDAEEARARAEQFGLPVGGGQNPGQPGQQQQGGMDQQQRQGQQPPANENDDPNDVQGDA